MIKIAKISLIASTIAIATFANFTFAQTSTTTSNLTLGYDDFAKADQSEADCKALATNKLEKYFQGLKLNYTTKWVVPQLATSLSQRSITGQSTIQGKGECHIAMKNSDGTAGAVLTDSTESMFRRGGAVGRPGSATGSNPAGVSQEAAASQLKAGQQTDSESSFWGNLVGYVLSAVAKLLATFVGGLTNLAGFILSKVVGYIGTPAPQIVSDGWLIIRDFMNMVFVLTLIVVSFGMILRQETYGSRKLVLRLILMALLINFSKVIAESIISFVDILTKTIAGSGDFFSYSQFFEQIIKIKTVSTAGFFANAGSQAVQSILQLVYALVACVVFVAITALLVVREVGLWFLIMVSPVAYAMNILPQTRTYATQWWQTFIKYLIWAPVALLFLQLGNRLMYASSTKPLSADSTLDFLFLTAFVWGGFIMAKRAGMYGSGAILSYAEKAAKGGSSMMSKYVLRGSGVKHAGQGLEKITGGRVTGLKTVGEKWQRTAQYTEAAPGAVATMFKKADENYQKGVSSAGKEILYKTGFVEDKEMLKNPKDTYRIFQDKLKSDKFTVNDMHDLINEMPRKSIAGAIQALSESERADLKPEANLALLEKIGERNAAPGTDLLREHPYGPMADGATGFQYVDPEDKSKGMNISYYRFNRNRNEVETQPQIRRYNANEKASELDSLSAQQRAATDQQYKEFKEALKKRSDHEKALGNNPDRENKIREAETKGEIIDSNRVKTYQKFVDAYDGAGDATVEIKQSIVTDTGKVMLNSEAAEALDIAKDQDRYFPKEQFSELKQALQTHGGISPEDLQKLEVAVQNLGGIQTQRGVVKPLEPIIREQLNAQGVKNFRVAQRQDKEHEGIHRFSDFIKQSNKQLAQDITNKIINTDKTKFEELKNEIKKIPAYANQDLSDDDIAGEIISQAKYRNQLNPDLTKEINQSIQSLKKEYMKAVFTTARTNKFMSRTGVLADKISNRDPKLEETTHVVRRL